MAKDNAAKKEDEAAEDAKKEAPEEKEGAAEGEEGAEGGEGTAPKKSKKKLIIIVAILLIVLLGGGAGAYFAFFKNSGEAGGEEGALLDKEGKPIMQAVYFTLPDFLLNLNTGTKQSSFLKATIIMEVPKETDIPYIEANLPRLMDAFNTYLRELRASDLAGSAGIQRLREELLLRANKALAPVVIKDVLFKQIVVQ